MQPQALQDAADVILPGLAAPRVTQARLMLLSTKANSSAYLVRRMMGPKTASATAAASASSRSMGSPKVQGVRNHKATISLGRNKTAPRPYFVLASL